MEKEEEKTESKKEEVPKKKARIFGDPVVELE